MAKLKDTEEAPTGPSTPQPSAAVMAAAASLQPAERVPDFSTNVQGATPQFPLVEPAAAFFLVFSANRWDVLSGRILPVLQRLSGVPGANGVGRAESGQPAMAQALAAQVEQGRIVIPHDIDGPGRSYLRPWQVGWQTDRRTKQTTPIYSWHTRWETLYIGTADVSVDEKGYADWLEGLIARGLLPKPPPFVYERLLSFYTAKLGSARGRGNGQHHTVPIYEERLKIVREAIAARTLTPAKPAEGVVPGLS